MATRTHPLNILPCLGMPAHPTRSRDGSANRVSRYIQTMHDCLIWKPCTIEEVLHGCSDLLGSFYYHPCRCMCLSCKKLFRGERFYGLFRIRAALPPSGSDKKKRNLHWIAPIHVYVSQANKKRTLQTNRQIRWCNSGRR